jgi:hypothetical protein
MIRLLRFLVTGDWHLHQWKIIRAVPLLDDSNEPVGFVYISKCEACGKLKEDRF